MNPSALTIPVTLLIISTIISACSQLPTRRPTESNVPSTQTGQQPPVPATSTQRHTVVSSAYQALGTPYRYGGTTANGFDCSGLTRHVYLASGITIPRTAGQQRDLSKTISSYSLLKPGDLIFFKTGRKTNHVGVFTGNGEFIHASTSRKRVIKAKLDTPYWRKHFVKFGTYIREN
jgi:cell wall-associated NlpC family hydrolase